MGPSHLICVAVLVVNHVQTLRDRTKLGFFAKSQGLSFCGDCTDGNPYSFAY
jgi:hypothetical protein